MTSDRAHASSWAGLQRLDFATIDRQRLAEFLGQAYGERLIGTGPDGHGATEFTVHHVDAGSVAVSDLELPGDLELAIYGSGQVVVGEVLDGTIQAERSTGTDEYGAGDVLMTNFPEASYLACTRDLHNHRFTLPLPLFYAVADGNDEPLRFVSTEPVSEAAAERWKSTGEFVDGVLDDPDAASSLLVVDNVARVLAATALAVFPNTAVTDPAAGDRRDASSLTLHRAVIFIDEHAQDEITSADIAAAALVTIRAVQLAFQRHLETTPTAYVRRVRLAHAHRELLEADPGRVSVSEVAHRWGFSTPSRFAVAYRQAYGIAPGAALTQRWR